MEPDLDLQILCIFIKGATLGASTYNPDSGELFALSDQRLDEPEWNSLKEFIREISPSEIILPASGELKEFIERCMESDALFQAQIHKVSSLHFNLSECTSRVLNLHFSFETVRPFKNEEHRRLYVTATLNETCECGIRATGALLNFCESRVKGPNGCGLEISAFKRLQLSDVLYMNTMTFEAFRVFEPSTRPSGSNAGKWNKSKEGLSIFRLLNRCQSSVGVKALSNMLRCPLRTHTAILKRQKLIHFLMAPEHRDLVQTLRHSLRNVKDLKGIVKRVANFTASVQDWKNLKKTIDSLLGMSRIMRDHVEKVDLFEKILRWMSKDVFSLSYFLENLFDIHESELKYRFIVKSGVDQVLDEKRRKHNGIPDLLTSIAQLEMEKLGDSIDECSIIYLPRIGYMVALKPMEDNMSDEDIKSKFSHLDFLFRTNGILHFKSDRCRDLDGKFGDTESEIKQIEFSIIHKLSTLALSLDEAMRHLTDLAGKLDALICFAVVSKEHGWIKPEILEDSNGQFIIEMGRHPLQEQCVNVYVPNTTVYDSPARISVLTGPNGSGKSVYLKQVGTLVYLAHLGSWIPANKAKIPLLKRIDTRIKATESLSLGLSSFAIDLHQMKSAMSTSSNDALVLIDEFGKGTNEQEGEALLIASLESFGSLGKNCPFVLVATHFTGSFHHLYNHPLLKFYTMDYQKKNESLYYFYKLVEGHSGSSSCANSIAASVDIPKDIITRASHLASRTNDQPFEYPPKWRSKIEALEKFGRRMMDMDFENVSREEMLQLPDFPLV